MNNPQISHAYASIKGVFTNIGRCRVCMRLSFKLAASAWLIAAAVYLAGLSTGILGVSAALLTSLWLLHISVYVARAGSSNDRTSMDRRRFFWLGHAFFAAALMTAQPALVRVCSNCKVCNSPPGFEGACCNGSAPATVNCGCATRENIDCSLCCS